VPTPKADVLNVATALPFSIAVPIEAPLSRNVTEPVGAPPCEVVTVAVKVTDWPPTIELDEVVIVVAVVRGLIPNGDAVEVLEAKFTSPEYCAVIACAPVANDETFSVACPELNVTAPNKTPLSKKPTLPVGLPFAVLTTVAVRVICWPNTGAVGNAPTVVVEVEVPGGIAVTKMACCALPPWIPARNANCPGPPAESP
jgi:hypothetical protein